MTCPICQNLILDLIKFFYFIIIIFNFFLFSFSTTSTITITSTTLQDHQKTGWAVGFKNPRVNIIDQSSSRFESFSSSPPFSHFIPNYDSFASPS